MLPPSLPSWCSSGRCSAEPVTFETTDGLGLTGWFVAASEPAGEPASQRLPFQAALCVTRRERGACRNRRLHDGLLVSRLRSSLSHRGRRGARSITPARLPRWGPRLARRDDREYREYLREKQRSQPGCIAGRMQTNFGDATLAAPCRDADDVPIGSSRHVL